MKKKTKLIILGIVLCIFLALLAGGVFLVKFFFGEKDYTFWKSKEMGAVQAVNIILTEEEDSDSVDFEVYDEEVLKEIQKALESVKMKPNYSINEPDDERYFNIELKDADKNYLSIGIGEWNNRYTGNVCMGKNGTLDDSLKSWINQVTISPEDGERLFQLLAEIKEEKLRKITVDEVVQLSEEGVYDWGYFRQYAYEDMEQTEQKTKGKLTTNSVAKLPIEGKEGYLMVWYYDGIVVDKEGTNSYQEVIDAVVCNEAGEERNLYDEGIVSFLEGLK